MNPADKWPIDNAIFGSGIALLTFSTLQLFADGQVSVITLILGILLTAAAPITTAWAYGYGREAYNNLDEDS